MAKRILLIDDEKDICKFTKLNIERSGQYEVTVANSGEEGLKKLAESTFDLVITDFKMPGMDGAAVVQAIKQRPSAAVPVVLFSVYHDDQNGAPRDALRQADGVISKPIDRQQMLKAIEDALAARRR